MANRFTDTTLNKQPWFRKLSCKIKCAVRFLFDECDNAGVWEIDMETMSYFVGEDVSLEEFFSAVNSDKESRIEKMGDKVFIPGFISFQYGKLTESCKPHLKVFSLLRKHGLFERVMKGYSKAIISLEEEEEDKEEEEEKEGKGSGGNHGSKKDEETVRQDGLKKTYEKLQKSSEGSPDREVFKTIREFVQANRPSFPEPFVDAWNIFAPTNNLSRVEVISQSRRDKIRIRTREPAFDFFKILSSIRQNGFYRGESDRGWKVDFNHVVESEDNYLKIIEKYRDS